MTIDTSRLENKPDSLRSFTIYNTGSGKLSVLDFTTSCECTALNLHKGDIIPAGDSLNIKIKVNTEGQDSDKTIFVTIKTNAMPQLTSFHFRP